MDVLYLQAGTERVWLREAKGMKTEMGPGSTIVRGQAEERGGVRGARTESKACAAGVKT